MRVQLKLYGMFMESFYAKFENQFLGEAEGRFLGLEILLIVTKLTSDR